MDAKTMEIAGVVYDYIKNGDQDTSREECIKWIKSLLAEATASIFTEEALRDAYNAGFYADEYSFSWVKQYRKERHGTPDAV